MEPRVPSPGSQGNPHEDRKYDRLSKLKQQNIVENWQKLLNLLPQRGRCGLSRIPITVIDCRNSNECRDNDGRNQNDRGNAKLHMPIAFVHCHENGLPKKQQKKAAHENGVEVQRLSPAVPSWTILAATISVSASAAVSCSASHAL